MKILYLSCHSILEYDELKLLTELGHEVFSLGAYTNPKGHDSLPRPGIPNMPYYPELEELSKGMPRTELRYEIYRDFDAVIVMHTPELIEQNWDRLRGKTVIWRSIGQSTPVVEKRLKKYRNEGLKIMRYSPYETFIPGYIGEDVMIRFYKDESEFANWNGNDCKIINFTQTLKGRREYCGYEPIMKVAEGLPFKVYGPGNEDLGEFNGGELPFELLKGQLRDSRVYLYRGTWPASYTLTFIEGLMTGIPMVCFGATTANLNKKDGMETYEVEKIINQGVDGFVYNDIEKMREVTQRLLVDKDYALQIGNKGREKAIQLFGKEKIKKEWQTFLETV